MFTALYMILKSKYDSMFPEIIAFMVMMDVISLIRLGK